MELLLDLYRNMKEKLVVGLSSPPPRAVGHFITDEDRQVWDQFEEWMVDFSKSYDSVAETEKRFEIFKENKREVERHNALNKSWTQKLDNTADLTLEEFNGLYRQYSNQHKAYSQSVMESSTDEDRHLWYVYEAWMYVYKKPDDNVAETEKQFEIFKENVREMERRTGRKGRYDITIDDVKHFVPATPPPRINNERYQLPIYYCI